MIIRESGGGVKYHYIYIYRLLHKWFQTEGTKKNTCQHSFKRRERTVQKRAQEILDNLPKEEGFTAVSVDESFFFFDSLVRKVWIEENSRPIVTVTGSPDIHVCLVP